MIVAAFNVESYIEKAVTSALNQAGVDVEVIVVNDASDDATAEVVRALGDDRVTLLENETNLGPSGARNRVLDAASGEWIAILDADD